MRAILLLASLAGLTTPPPLMGYVDVPKLGKFCAETAADAPNDKGICLGYVAGAVDQLMAQQAVLPTPLRTVCVPEGATIDDAVGVVRKYSAWASTVPGVGAAGFIKIVMERAYPCAPPNDDGASPCAPAATAAAAPVAAPPPKRAQPVGCKAGK